MSKKLCHHTFVYWQTLTNLDRFSFFSLSNSPLKFTTKIMSYFSPHSVTALPCKTQKTETGKILLHVTQQLLFNVHKINKYDRQNKICITWSWIKCLNFLLSPKCPHRDVYATCNLRHWWHFAGHWSSAASVHRRRKLGRLPLHLFSSFVFKGVQICAVWWQRWREMKAGLVSVVRYFISCVFIVT